MEVNRLNNSSFKIEQKTEFIDNNIMYDIKIVEDLNVGIKGILIFKQEENNGEIFCYIKGSKNRKLEIREYNTYNDNKMVLNDYNNEFKLQSGDLNIDLLTMEIKDDNDREKLVEFLINTKKHLINFVFNKLDNNLKKYEIINDIYNILNSNIDEEELTNILNKYDFKCDDLNKSSKLYLKRGNYDRNYR